MSSDGLQSSNCLISISFKLERARIVPTEVNKKKFPYAVKPKSSSAAQVDRHFMNTTQKNQSLPKVKLYTPENDIPRPRNSFILARSMLSKPVRAFTEGATDQISKVLSIVSISDLKTLKSFSCANFAKVWKLNEDTGFQEYFNYLSEMEDYWHESYYPLYHYNPKRKALELEQQHTSVIIIGNPANLGPPSVTPTESPPSATQLFTHHPHHDPSESSFYYKDCTTKFHINRVSKGKRGKTPHKKGPLESVMKLYLKPSKYPDLLDNKVEDFYLE